MSTTDPVTAFGDETLVPFDEQVADIGDNSDAAKRIFLTAVRKQIDLNAERDALNKKISAARKQFKAQGITLGHMDTVIRMMEWAPSEVREYFAIQQEYAGWANLPVGTQIDLLAHSSDEEVSAMDWRSRGYSARMTGKDVEPPKECPPEMVQHWQNGVTDADWVNVPGRQFLSADGSTYTSGGDNGEED